MNYKRLVKSNDRQVIGEESGKYEEKYVRNKILILKVCKHSPAVRNGISSTNRRPIYIITFLAYFSP